MIQHLFQGRLVRPLTFFDLETTGVDVRTDHIVEIAMVRLEPGGVVKEFTSLVNPCFPIPPSATAIHGLADEDVANAPKFADIADEVLLFLEGSDVGGYNIRKFDIPLLQDEFLRCGKKWVVDLDVMSILDGCDIFFKMEPRSLSGALKFYCGREHIDAHGAMSDVKATMDVVSAQLFRYEFVGSVGEVCAELRDPDMVDLGGKLRWVGPDICVNFGKHIGTPLKKLSLDYLQWMLKQHVVGFDAEYIISKALHREYMTREVSNNEEKKNGK